MDYEAIFIILKELGVNKTDVELIKAIQKNREGYYKALGEIRSAMRSKTAEIINDPR